MARKHKLFLIWGLGACMILGSFYAAVAWLWSAAEESRAASLEREVVSALSNDLAEGNLFKLGATLAKLQRDGELRFAEIRHLNDGRGSGVIFKTQGAGEGTDDIFARFQCGQQKKIIRHGGGGVSLITTLSSNAAGSGCAALFIGSDLPAELKRFKNRLIAAFGLGVLALFGFFGWFTMFWYQRITDLQVKNRLMQVEKESEIGRIAAQVAHDIRSPLAALDAVVGGAAQLPEEQRLIVRSAVGRIHDIANHLLEKYRKPMDNDGNGGLPEQRKQAAVDVWLLSSLIAPVVTEKRLEVQSRPSTEIDAPMDSTSYGHFAAVDPAEFKPLLSNLIQNAVEAIGQRGRVEVILSREQDRVVLTIRDNGKGIPPEVIGRLGLRGFTHDKPGGSGLGLHHAKAAVDAWGGSLEIRSEVGKGTTVAVKLPAAPPPAWFVSDLELFPNGAVIVLDDDPTIHQIWQGRFDAPAVRGAGVDSLHFSNTDELRRWVKAAPEKAEGAVYLLDYELRGSAETGLTLVEELSLGDRAILVTSRFEEKAILEACLRLKVRMIPKGLAGFVPITLRKRGEQPDAVLIDDDRLVHMVWKVAAKTNGKTLDAFSTPREFLAIVGRLDKKTPIYVDSKLADGVRGEEFAKELHTQGFRNLYLATGHQRGVLLPMPWIKEVVGKKAPWV